MASGHYNSREAWSNMGSRNAADSHYRNSGQRLRDPQQESHDEARPSTGDREELIRRIKRGERPQWTPSEQLLRLLAENVNEDRELPLDRSNTTNASGSNSRQQDELGTGKSQDENLPVSRSRSNEQMIAGLSIERPRSALHKGDFSTPTSPDETTPAQFVRPATFFSTSPPRPTAAPFSNARIIVPKQPHRVAFSKLVPPSQSNPLRPRAPSLQSGSPAYVLKPPTSPLVRETSNDDLDIEQFMDIDSPERRHRRHTITPIGSLPTTSDYTSLTHAARLPASLRKENTFPKQGHHHRRSMNASYSYQLASSPQTPPFLRSRAPSFSSDSSPRQATMVGSYEESILRGRMSGTPSQPLNFTAEIGAVAVSPYKPTCPAHVHVDFPAVYYSWPAGIGRVGSSGQEPSPYVGRIDLANNLAPPKSRDERRRQRHEHRGEATNVLNDHDANVTAQRQKKRKRHENVSQEDLLGGCYRIPQKGSLQIIIKTPTKSAAKVFVVPYDLDGMEAGNRTWLRQRCYSAGPIMERPLTSRHDSIASESQDDRHDLKTKATLRYLIHLKICSPSKGRYYLYDEIRVVFANRVPDNKESLKYEVQMPEPKFVAFKPQSRQRSISNGSSLALESLDIDEDRSSRRRSYGLDGPGSLLRSLPASASGPQSSLAMTPSTPVPALPSIFSARSRSFTVGTMSEQEATDADTVSSGSIYLQSPSSGYLDRKAANGQVSSPETWKRRNMNAKALNERLVNAINGVGDEDDNRFTKLKHEDKRYGGIYGRPATPEPGEGLLARRLRSLDMEEADDKD